MPLRPLPLTTEVLNKIKTNIKTLAEGYQTLEFDINDIGCVPGSRSTVESSFWPRQEAVDFFEKEGAIKKKGQRFEILRLDYFGISFDNLELPVQFSIDKRIETDLKVMTGLYAEIFDIENRLRFTFEERLVQKYGTSFLGHLPADVQNSIAREKSNPRWHVTETRARELSYTNFSDLIKILIMPVLYSDDNVRKATVDKLNYLAEVRTRVAHNNLIPAADVEKTKEYADQVRNLIAQLKPA
jgi:hypothetical protein